MTKFNDDEPAGPGNWYARKVYGDKYTELKGEFQRRKMADLNK
jgi:hypothetical protein